MRQLLVKYLTGISEKKKNRDIIKARSQLFPKALALNLSLSYYIYQQDARSQLSVDDCINHVLTCNKEEYAQ